MSIALATRSLSKAFGSLPVARDIAIDLPVGSTITTVTSRTPIQKYQTCGAMPENWSRATMKMVAPISPP